MKKIVGFVVLFLLSFSSSAQEVMDTLYTEEGTMLIYKNRTWAYLEDINFDGVLNQRLHQQLTADTTLKVAQPWNNNVCFTSGLTNNLSSLKDTIWLCLVDSTHETFKMPTPGIVTSNFGYRHGRHHYGIDLDLESGDTVKAAFSGKVRYAQYNGGGFGNLVIIRHYNGLETFYAHLKQCNVVPNQIVNAGDPIGVGGNTGHSYGSHLHFEVRFLDQPINPEKIIDFKNHSLIKENLLVNKSFFGPYSSSYTSSGDFDAGSTSSVYHRIRSGETLSYLARKYHSSVSRICSLNHIRPTTILQIGRRLKIR